MFPVLIYLFHNCFNSLFLKTLLIFPLFSFNILNIKYLISEHNINLDDKLLHGMLLYGTNAAGKSSLMKAIGLNLIMAQAGMFVPCNSFVFNPFNQIFTRINNNDNIFKGESSFAVEMGELGVSFSEVIRIV